MKIPSNEEIRLQLVLNTMTLDQLFELKIRLAEINSPLFFEVEKKYAENLLKQLNTVSFK